MNRERLVAGLDIGSAKTTAIIAEVIGELPRRPSIRVLGVGQARTTGLRRGVVADIEETTRSIRKAMEEAERMAGAKVESVYVGIAGEHVDLSGLQRKADRILDGARKCADQAAAAASG